MRHAWNRRIAFSFASACGMVTVALGQAPENPRPPIPSQRQVVRHRATTVLQQENQAGKQLQENDFTRPNQNAFKSVADRSLMKSINDVGRAGVPFPDEVLLIKGRMGFGLPIPAAGGDRDDDPASEMQLEVASKAFDLEVFGSTGDAETARDFMNGLLAQKISQSEAKHRWAPHEKKKLVLAGRGDIKRLLDRIEAERKTLERVPTAPVQSREFLLRLRALRLEIRRGPFGTTSLFAKTLKKIQDDENLARRAGSFEARATGLLIADPERGSTPT